MMSPTETHVSLMERGSLLRHKALAKTEATTFVRLKAIALKIPTVVSPTVPPQQEFVS